MSELKLAAFDEDDLKVVSAHCQDAVFKTSDIVYDAAAGRVIFAVNRFVWEKKTGFLRRDFERRRSVLQFDRVTGVRLSGIDRSRGDDVHELLALRFLPDETPANAPAGTVELVLAGTAGMRLAVECIEARLADLGAAWETGSRPRHSV